MKPFSLMLVPEQGRMRAWRITPRTLIALSCALLLLVGAAAWGGWTVWRQVKSDDRVRALQAQLAMVQAREQARVRALQSKLDASRKQLAAYARDIGAMQARLARLDALGSKLVETASLDPSEFNFGLAPAVGGPKQNPVPVAPAAIDTSLEQLDARLSRLDEQLAAIDYLLEQQRSEQAARPHAWPTEGGWISSRYGPRIDPFNGGREIHRGVDIANRFGAPVLAASHGIVTFAGKMKGFGYMIDIDHGYGYVTRYGHMSSIAVKVGDEVSDGQVIGRIGSRGRSTGPHLHFEVHRYGKAINPMPFLPRG